MSVGLNPDHPCGRCAYYSESVWSSVKLGSVSALQRGFSRIALSEGQALFSQGDRNRGIFCVSEGLVALRTLHAEGTSTLIRLAYPGEVVGFRSFLSAREHRTEARALLPSRICLVGRRDADHLVQGDTDVLMKLASRCVSEIDQNHDRIIAAATKSNKQRLSDLLLRLMKVHGTRAEGQIRMRLPLSRLDLADLIGVQPETVSRLINRLRKDGAFFFSGRHVSAPLAMLVELQNAAE
ncbi:Crp/Fnr family transcriptional regulator [Sulfitobacter sp. JB4-11]|uniref:Crp/Fnr family transcriptional regulator n=1 Tax=Sulfitobacter rhodophyticola TaxID=3238304 RepID=UPI003516C5C1